MVCFPVWKLEVLSCFLALWSVLWIRDILVPIWIRGYMRLIISLGSGSGSCYFRPWPSRRQQKGDLDPKTSLTNGFGCGSTRPKNIRILSYGSGSGCGSGSPTLVFWHLHSGVMMVKGSGSGSGYVPLTSGSGSGCTTLSVMMGRTCTWNQTYGSYESGSGSGSGSPTLVFLALTQCCDDDKRIRITIRICTSD